MANIISEKQINSFVKGLITEAGPLSFPEGASLEEENFDLNIDGSRYRRLGIDFEDEYALNSTGISESVLASTKISSHNWEFPGGSNSVFLGVVRIHERLYFLDLLAANPSGNLMNQGNYITIAGLENSEIQVAVLNGYFVIVSEDLQYPVILTYDEDADEVTQDVLYVLVRDLEGVFESIAQDVRPTTLTQVHKYNLINQGWSDTISSVCSTPSYVKTTQVGRGQTHINVPAVTVSALDCTYSRLGVYPSNADKWSLGKKATAYDATTLAELEKYSPELMVKASTDNTLVSRGSVILDVFNRGPEREETTGVTGLPLDLETGRFTTIAAFSGRICYSGITSKVTDGDNLSPNYSGYIFFSQIARNKNKFGLCYQENDPTSPNISDILDTDGGTIQIPEISKVTKLMAVRNSLLVFAENGIWEIFGDTKGFVATSFQSSKVSNIGVSNANSIVDANGNILYWAKTGIYVITQDGTTGRLKSDTISLTTIQTFYNDIPDIAKLNSKGIFNELSNHISWMYNDSEEYAEFNYINKYTKELNFDLNLMAFYVYTINSIEINSPYICSYFTIPSYSLTSITSDIYAGNEQIIDTSLESVVIDINTNIDRGGKYNFLTLQGDAFTLSKYKDTSFIDWYSSDGVGISFESFVITGYEYSGDLMRNKQIPYILFYFKRTEDGFTQVGDNLILDNQSSCLVQAQWNWANSTNSGRWGTEFQAYRLLRNYIPSGAEDNFDYGYEVVVTKNKLRGKGKVVSLKITSEDGKDMQLLGWAMVVTGNSKPSTEA